MSPRVRAMLAIIEGAAVEIDAIQAGRVELHFGEGGIALEIAQRHPRRKVGDFDRLTVEAERHTMRIGAGSVPHPSRDGTQGAAGANR